MDDADDCVAHEINTPVGAITSMHDTLTRAVAKLRKSIQAVAPGSLEDDPGIRNSFKIIEDANSVIESGSSRVTNIVRPLRSFARLDEAELKPVDVHDGLDDTLTLVHHELKRGITVHKNYGKIPPIACYPGQLNQVFLNLLVNARQGIDGQGDITITTGLEDGEVKIRFTDNGAGIPKDRLSRIFDPGLRPRVWGSARALACRSVAKLSKPITAR